MSELFSISDIIKYFNKEKVDHIFGNVIFPSNPSKRILRNPQGDEVVDVANSAGLYAREIGLIYNNSWTQGKDMEFEALLDMEVGECFLRFKKRDRFEEVMGIFLDEGQGLPYYIFGSDGGPTISFESGGENISLNPKYRKIS